MSAQTNNPLHGITLEQIVTKLEQHFGWQELGRRINIKCFNSDPSIKSSLKFLRKTPWAREKVEQLFISNNLHLQVATKQKVAKTKKVDSPKEEQTKAKETQPKTRGSFGGNKNRKRSF